MRALVWLALCGCADRPLPLPESNPDLAPLCRPNAGDLCYPLGHCCTQDSDCCTFYCQPPAPGVARICFAAH